MHLIISCSLNKYSKSRVLAKYAYGLYLENVKFLDLQDYELPMCDGDTCYENSSVDEVKNYIKKSKTILIASPIYNYDFNSMAKNLIELTGRSWTEKIVGFISAAGGKGSYMAPMSFANSLMLDYRCIIVPRFIYADKSCFNEKGIANDTIKIRIKELVIYIEQLSNSIC